MALITCPDCSKEISDKASSCPNCGFPFTDPILKEKSNVDISNYLKIAQDAFKGKNYSEAVEYCNKIIEVETDNYKAMVIKGKSVGWLSTLNNIRCAESINIAKQCIGYAPQSEKTQLANELIQEIGYQIEALMNIYFKMPTIGRVGYHGALHELFSSWIETMNIPLASENVLDNQVQKCRIREECEGNSMGVIQSRISIDDTRNKFNSGKWYWRCMEDAVKHISKINEDILSRAHWSTHQHELRDKIAKNYSMIQTYTDELLQLDEQIQKLRGDIDAYTYIVQENKNKLFGDNAKKRKEAKINLENANQKLTSLENNKKSKKDQTYQLSNETDKLKQYILDI